MQKRLPGIFLVLALSVGFSVNSFAAAKDIAIKNSVFFVSLNLLYIGVQRTESLMNRALQVFPACAFG